MAAVRSPRRIGSRHWFRPWLAAIAGAGLVALAMAGLFAWWLFAEFDGVKRGSLAWHVALPGYLTSLPIPEACDEPVYSFHGIDGARPQIAAVRFQTRLAPDAVRSAYAPLLAGCQPADARPAQGWRCAGRDYGEIEIDVGTASQGACRRIDVRFIAR